MAVKGEKGSPVRAVNRRQCADTLFWRLALCTSKAYFAFTNCFLYYQGIPGLQGPRGPPGPAGLEGRKGEKVVAY